MSVGPDRSRWHRQHSGAYVTIHKGGLVEADAFPKITTSEFLGVVDGAEEMRELAWPSD
jgi:hypothetical protein